jgi:NitT/TauT family transport system ATP-binding protein
MFAGLQKPTSGTVSYRGQPVNPSWENRFYLSGLFAVSVADGAAEHRVRSEHPRGEGGDELGEGRAASRSGQVDGFEDTYPSKLSGGMRQRVAIVIHRQRLGRPPHGQAFSALDVQTRWEMQDFLIQTKKATHKTIVFVTHDLDEAVYLADRIYICSPRPLTFEQEVIVPFSANDRKTSLGAIPCS